MAEAGGQQALGAGSFYGAVQSRRELCGAIFTDLRHTSPRKLPAHSHELPFFAILMEGLYGERYGREERQFRPFTAHFRPAGVPHQDEIGPHGLRFFEIEIRPSWRKRLEECSAALDVARDDTTGGELLWLGMKLFHEVHGARAGDDLSVASLLTELMASAARMPRERMQQRPAWLGRIIEKLAVEYSARLTLDALSREAGVHPVHLSRVFRKCMGEGMGEHVHRLRVRAACEQMLEPEISLAEISLAAGFADQSHFTRAFRRVTGMSPGRFREILGGRSPQSRAASPSPLFP
ncbi:MAG: AraC family transcriptional regulator [Terriglobales bacterium]